MLLSNSADTGTDSMFISFADTLLTKQNKKSAHTDVLINQICCT